MSTSDLIEAMKAEGVDPDTILGVVARLDEIKVERRREKTRARVRRHREKQRSEVQSVTNVTNVTEVTPVTVTGVTSPPLDGPPSFPPTPPKTTPPIIPPTLSSDASAPDPSEPPGGEVRESFDRIWACWSREGRQRSKSRAKCQAALKRAAQSTPLSAIERAAKLYAKTTDGGFHKALDRWLADGRYENYQPQDRTPSRDAPADPLERCFASFAKTGEWRGDRHGFPIPPNRADATYDPSLYAKHGVPAPQQMMLLESAQ